MGYGGGGGGGGSGGGSGGSGGSGSGGADSSLLFAVAAVVWKDAPERLRFCSAGRWRDASSSWGSDTDIRCPSVADCLARDGSAP